MEKKLTDRQKVEKWLSHIKEFDEEIRADVLNQCAKDMEARKYYVGRYEADCK